MENNKIILFQDKSVRRVWLDDQWYFSVIDVVGILTDSPQPSSYWNKVKKEILKESDLLRFWQKLKLKGQDGKTYPSDCANTEGILRILMNIPSPKVEPFKLWMAQVGYERIQEIENPELAIDRAGEMYRAKGYPDDWIGYREKSILIRKELTDEWKKRGVKEGQEYAILTAEISKATFGLTPTEYKDLKGLDRQNLRDHMTNLELIYTMLGEESTRSIAVDKDAQGFQENQEAAIMGGAIAAKSRHYFERKTGQKVIKSSNFLALDKPEEQTGDIDKE